jgi:hypothetical protein
LCTRGWTTERGMNALELERLQGRSLSHESHTGRLAPKGSWAQVVRSHQEDPVNIGVGIAELPSELLVQLWQCRQPLEVICAMAHLSKAFCEVARTAQGLLEQADFRKWRRTVDDAAVAGVVSKCPRLSSLSLWGCCMITDAAVLAVALECPQLTTLVLGGTSHCDETRGTCFQNITDAAVVAVASGCPQLTSLSLYDCLMITDAAVVALASGCQLTTLHLSGCLINDAAVVAVASGCPQLSSLSLSGCGNITDVAVVAVASGCPQLTTLVLGGLWNSQLSSLSLSGCGNITDVAVVAVASGCPQLTTLVLGGLWNCEDNITDAATMAVASGCPQLTSLDLYGRAHWARALAVQSREVSAGSRPTRDVTTN